MHTSENTPQTLLANRWHSDPKSDSGGDLIVLRSGLCKTTATEYITVMEFIRNIFYQHHWKTAVAGVLYHYRQSFNFDVVGWSMSWNDSSRALRAQRWHSSTSLRVVIFSAPIQNVLIQPEDFIKIITSEWLIAHTLLRNNMTTIRVSVFLRCATL